MEMTTAKTIAVFAIIFGCFAVLYPKIFHPMILHIFGMAPASRTNENINGRMPPHMRPHPSAATKRSSSHDEGPSHMRASGHPGLRAAAEMKKTTAQQSTGGKGMMGVILPMYAVGIVIYLIYTLVKVFTRKENASSTSSGGGDYLSNHFSDIRSGGDKRKVTSAAAAGNSATERQTVQKQKELEKLLMKAENEDISDFEMNELKRRLLETEAQMSRILQAMEAVQQKVGVVADLTTEAADDRTQERNDSSGVEDIGPRIVDADVDEDDTEDLSADAENDGDTSADEMDADNSTEQDELDIQQSSSAGDERNYSSLADELKLGQSSAEDSACGDSDSGDGPLVNSLRRRVQTGVLQ